MSKIDELWAYLSEHVSIETGRIYAETSGSTIAHSEEVRNKALALAAEISALLRAGQELYDACSDDNIDNASTVRIHYALVAWDEALGGGE